MAYSIDLSGRIAFITGASGGLGAQFARTLSAAGAAVVLASRRIDKLKDLRAEIEGQGGDAHVIELDVTDHDSIKSAVAHAETEVGSIDILINNSGVSTTQRLQDVSPEDYDFIFDTNVKGSFFVAQEVGKRMIARAVQGTAGATHRAVAHVQEHAARGRGDRSCGRDRRNRCSPWPCLAARGAGALGPRLALAQTDRRLTRDQVRTLPSPVSIESSTNDDATWSFGPREIA